MAHVHIPPNIGIYLQADAAHYQIELPDGTSRTGVLDANGRARFDGIEPGQCRITFPTLDKDAWDSKK